MAPLPIDPVLPAIVDAVRAGHLVVHAPTGAGKTTRVPRALLDAGVTDGRIVVLEPRRVAARAAAARMAEELGESVGETVGYQVRLERRASARTRVLVVTEGVLLRQLVADPFLDGVGVVVVDEVHERSVDADLSLAMLRHLHAQVRPDLRLVAMSATADTARLATFLDAPVVRSEGRTFPVDVRYLPRPDDRDLEVRVADAVVTALAAHPGDVLVFLPGAGEIRRAAALLAGRVGDVDVVELHGRLPPDQQDRALRPGPRRRVVLSTNVAETSVTIPGVTSVVDAGLVRTLQHAPSRGLDRLVVVPCSKASADQRAGRAGRTAPGVAWRLWTERQHHARPDHDAPEVLRVDLSGPLLALHAWGEPDPAAFPWLEAPPAHAIAAAEELLTRLGALDGGRLSPVGQAMAALPVHPRLARLLVAAHRAGVVSEAAEIAALLGDRLPLRRDGPARHRSDDDLEDLRDALHRPGRHGWQPVSPGAVDRSLLVARQLADRTTRALGPAPAPGTPEDLRRALLAGWPDRVACQRGQGLLLATGRGARRSPRSAVDAPWIVAVEVVDDAGAEAQVHLACAIDPAWLPVTTAIEVTYDPERDRVVGARRTRWMALVVDAQEGVEAPADAVHAALVDAVRADPARARPKDDADLDRLLGRLAFLARVRPDVGLPAVDADGLAEVAAELAVGRRSLAELRRAPWVDAVRGRLTWDQRQILDTLAPERLEVPSGSAIRLDYPPEGPPVLAVRMQELFGLARTPTVAGQPVLLHLLAPNGRPQQVTDDLPGFWARAWPEVRKELRGRYPKHAWPEDPLTATAQRRPGRPPQRP
ncbi:MAG: ATP-dependent helicase HrpB [Alphaproteobacteria bacterium]|nr:ATP-dependent helicase HrpB [Alphaproteobacteria bacterium]